MVVVSLDQMLLDVLVPLAAQREMAIAQHQRGNYNYVLSVCICRNVNGKNIIDSAFHSATVLLSP